MLPRSRIQRAAVGSAFTDTVLSEDATAGASFDDDVSAATQQGELTITGLLTTVQPQLLVQQQASTLR